MITLSSRHSLSARAMVFAMALWAAPAMAQTLNADLWVPDGPVYAIARSGNTIYIGGRFQNVGPATGGAGVARNNIAALDATTGAATAWDPNISGSFGVVNALAVSGGTVYVGGSFALVGGRIRHNLAALDAATGLVTSWNPSVGGRVLPLVQTLAVSGTTIYVGGLFSRLGAADRNNIGAVDASTGAVTAWNPNADNGVLALLVNGSTVYAGGQFSFVGGELRTGVAALDVASGTATAWDPAVHGAVAALSLRGSTLYVGGDFTGVGAASRIAIAAVDTATGAATTWDPGLSGAYPGPYTLALAVSDQVVYAGGKFSLAGGQPRNNITALDATTATPLPWDPATSANVLALYLDGTTLYVGGWFNTIAGQAHPYLAALTAATTGTVCAHGQGFWKKHPDAWPIEALTLGTISYTEPALLALLQAPVRGDASLILARQLIAARLNIASGVDERPVSAALFTADSLIGGATLPLGIGPGSAAGRLAVAVAGRLEGLNTGAFSPACVKDDDEEPVLGMDGPASFSLSQNRPNPLLPAATTRIDFSLSESTRSRLAVHDLSGRVVRTLVDGVLGAGPHSVSWDGRDENGRSVPAGIYFYRLTAGARSSAGKALIVK